MGPSFLLHLPPPHTHTQGLQPLSWSDLREEVGALSRTPTDPAVIEPLTLPPLAQAAVKAGSSGYAVHSSRVKGAFPNVLLREETQRGKSPVPYAVSASPPPCSQGKSHVCAHLQLRPGKCTSVCCQSHSHNYVHLPASFGFPFRGPVPPSELPLQTPRH